MDFLSHQKSPCIICQCAYIDLNIKNSSEPVCLSKVNRTERERESEKKKKCVSSVQRPNWKIERPERRKSRKCLCSHESAFKTTNLVNIHWLYVVWKHLLFHVPTNMIIGISLFSSTFDRFKSVSIACGQNIKKPKELLHTYQRPNNFIYSFKVALIKAPNCVFLVSFDF